MLRNMLPTSALNFKDKMNTPIRGSFMYSTNLKPLSDPGECSNIVRHLIDMLHKIMSVVEDVFYFDPCCFSCN